MNYMFVILLGLSLTSFGQNETVVERNTPDVKPFVIGETVEMYSETLGEERILNIYLPNEYSPDSSHLYPVIYLLDSSPHEDFIHIAGLVQFASSPAVDLMPQSIVVGIESSDHMRDYTYPPKNEEYLTKSPTAGGSKNFMDFIEKELQPYVEENYKTAKHRTIIGHSMGGVLVTEVLIKRSYLFDDYIVVSPSIWWDDRSLLLEEPTVTDDPHLYVTVGDEAQTMVEGTVEIYSKMKHIVTPGNAYYKKIEGQNHNDVFHSGVYEAFKALHKKPETSTSPE
ncbi:MAG: putative alpha/beta superfamily hydrolase [Crocinitomicaceae bacterium]|jgi:predicted alpha/beta superfamily hydrolase